MKNLKERVEELEMRVEKLENEIYQSKIKEKLAEYSKKYDCLFELDLQYGRTGFLHDDLWYLYDENTRVGALGKTVYAKSEEVYDAICGCEGMIKEYLMEKKVDKLLKTIPKEEMVKVLKECGFEVKEEKKDEKEDKVSD